MAAAWWRGGRSRSTELIEPRGEDLSGSGDPGSCAAAAAEVEATAAAIVVVAVSTAVVAATAVVDTAPVTGWVTVVVVADCDCCVVGWTTAGVAGCVARQYASRNSAKCSHASSNWFSSRITSNISCWRSCTHDFNNYRVKILAKNKNREWDILKAKYGCQWLLVWISRTNCTVFVVNNAIRLSQLLRLGLLSFLCKSVIRFFLATSYLWKESCYLIPDSCVSLYKLKMQMAFMTAATNAAVRTLRCWERDFNGDAKMTDMKMMDQIAGHENAGHEIAGHEIARWQELIAFCSILVFFLYFDADVAAMELCNLITKWIEKKSNDRLHVTSLRVELSDQVTTPTILICNINNETIKICSSCKQFSTVQCTQIREHCYIYDEQVQLSFPR